MITTAAPISVAELARKLVIARLVAVPYDYGRGERSGPTRSFIRLMIQECIEEAENICEMPCLENSQSSSSH